MWRSPTGFVDSDSKWTDEDKAYDDNEIGTWAYVVPGGEGYYLELKLGAIVCDSVRIYASEWRNSDASDNNLNISVDVYYNEGWHNILNDVITRNTWVIAYIGSSQTVTRARIKFNAVRYDFGRLKEFDFWEVEVGMTLTEMITAIQEELQEAGTIFDTTLCTRAVVKTVAIMSRFMPKRAILETTLIREVTSETLTISSSTGTLAYKPIKVGSLAITGKALDTDYRVNYMTGVVTEIGSLLADTDYTAKYDLDPLMLDIDTFLPEESYIKIERVEYPVGDDPPSYVTFEVFGEFLLVKGKAVSLANNRHLRIIYLKPWTTPTASAAATLTTSLSGSNNDLVFTARVGGTVGNATTIKYTDPGGDGSISIGVSGTDITVTLAYGSGAITSTAADVEAAIEADSDAVALVSIVNASSNDGTGLVTAMGETALTGGSDTGVDGDYPEHLDNVVIIGAVGQALIFMAEKYVQDARTQFTDADTSSGSMSTPLADITVALDKAFTPLAQAVTYLEAGDDLINAVNVGASAAGTYAAYANAQIAIAQAWLAEGAQRITEVASFQSKANVEIQIGLQLLTIAGRYLASGQAKINEFLISLGLKPEYSTHRSSSEQFS